MSHSAFANGARLAFEILAFMYVFEHCKKPPLLSGARFSLSMWMLPSVLVFPPVRFVARERGGSTLTTLGIPTPALSARLLSPAVSISTLSSSSLLMPFSSQNYI
jgi:hypothetical protein